MPRRMPIASRGEVGVLVVKGIERSRYALACALGRGSEGVHRDAG